MIATKVTKVTKLVWLVVETLTFVVTNKAGVFDFYGAGLIRLTNDNFTSLIVGMLLLTEAGLTLPTNY